MNENSDNVERGDAQGDLGCRRAFQVIFPGVQAADRFPRCPGNLLHSDFRDLSLGSYHFRKINWTAATRYVCGPKQPGILLFLPKFTS